MARAERDLEHLLRPSATGVGLEVAAVDPGSAQLVWSRLAAGRHRVVVGSHQQWVEHRGGPGALEVTGLSPGTGYDLQLCTEHGEVVARTQLRTSPAPRGERLCRVATISDLHLGHETHRARHIEAMARPGDTTGRPTDRSTEPVAQGRSGSTVTAHHDRAWRCARAAVDEAIAWGADLLIVKGDICEESVEHTWDLAAELLRDVSIPVMLLPGNHDTGRLRQFEPEHAATARGLEVVRGVQHLDLPGLRVVGVDSTRPGTSWGAVARHGADVADLVRGEHAAMVATHHQPQRFRVPLYWPPGIPGPDARRFARTVLDANRSVLATSGHTHRNVRRRVAGLDWTEVASTSHFPAAWAGYSVHEGGLHQCVRRIADPDVLEWSERSRRMLGGVWALWSAGSLDHRCFTKDW